MVLSDAASEIACALSSDRRARRRLRPRHDREPATRSLGVREIRSRRL